MSRFDLQQGRILIAEPFMQDPQFKKRWLPFAIIRGMKVP